MSVANTAGNAIVVQLVVRHLAKEEVASSSLVYRSREADLVPAISFFAIVVQLVVRHLAKVEVASSSLVYRSFLWRTPSDVRHFCVSTRSFINFVSTRFFVNFASTHSFVNFVSTHSFSDFYSFSFLSMRYSEMELLLKRLDRMRIYLPPINEGRLKMLAVFTMLIDHVTYSFLEKAYDANGQLLSFSLENGRMLDHIGRMIGRQAFPIFCFFLVVGFRKTHSRAGYLARLLIFSALSQFPFQKCIFPGTDVFHASVMVTLTLGMLLIWVIDSADKAFLPHEEDQSRDNPFGILIFLAVSAGAVFGFCRLAVFLHSDYSYGGVILILLMYLLRKYRILSLFISWMWLSWYNRFEMYAAPAFFLLACYNGKRGRQNKYFYYVFYPAHLLLIWLVRRHFFGM